MASTGLGGGLPRCRNGKQQGELIPKPMDEDLLGSLPASRAGTQKSLAIIPYPLVRDVEERKSLPGASMWRRPGKGLPRTPWVCPRCVLPAQVLLLVCTKTVVRSRTLSRAHLLSPGASLVGYLNSKALFWQALHSTSRYSFY